MFAELFDKLHALTTRAVAPQKLDVADPAHARFVVNGSVLSVPLPVPPRGHKAGSLEDLVRLANRFAEAGDAPAVWYDRGSVVLVIDDADRRNQVVTLDLAGSEVFAALQGVARAKTKFEHKPFLRFLRIDLAGCLDPVVLLNPARKVKFENGVTVKSDVQRNRESLGRSITSAVEAETELPEQVTLLVPVYATLGERERYPVRCSVEVDPAEGSFRLLPLPDELDLAAYSALGSIADRLAAGLAPTVPAYHGKP